MKIGSSTTSSWISGNNVCRSPRRFQVLICLALAAAVAPAQMEPTFEVASIKPAAPLNLAEVRAGIQNGEIPRLGPRVDGARAEYIYMTVAELIALAYNVKSDQITGPGWIATQRFDIIAKLPEGASRNGVPRMLQSLLEDGFNLALHRESKECPALALVVGERGPKMKEASEVLMPIDPGAPLAPGEKQVDSPDGPVRMTYDTKGGATMNMGENGTVSYAVDPATRSMKIEASRVTMTGFAGMLTILLRATGGSLPVKDMTGLTGRYQVAITFSLEDLKGAARSKWIDEPDPPAGATGAATLANEPSEPGNSPSLFKAMQSPGTEAGLAKGHARTTGHRPP